MKIEDAEIEIEDDDIWINGDLISRSRFTGIWTVFQENDVENKFDTLEEAAKYCLEQGVEQ